MPVETFEGQLTRANVQLAVRSGVLTEGEAIRRHLPLNLLGS